MHPSRTRSKLIGEKCPTMVKERWESKVKKFSRTRSKLIGERCPNNGERKVGVGGQKVKTTRKKSRKVGFNRAFSSPV